MAVTGYWYPKVFARMGSGTGKMDFVADSASMKCALMHTNFTGANQSLSLASYWADVSAYEVATATGYTSKTIGTTAITPGGASNKTVKYSASASVVWTTATLTARGAVVYKSVAAASDSPVMFFLDFGADVPANSGDFTITWHSDGMATVTTA